MTDRDPNKATFLFRAQVQGIKTEVLHNHEPFTADSVRDIVTSLIAKKTKPQVDDLEIVVNSNNIEFQYTPNKKKFPDSYFINVKQVFVLPKYPTTVFIHTANGTSGHYSIIKFKSEENVQRLVKLIAETNDEVQISNKIIQPPQSKQPSTVNGKTTVAHSVSTRSKTSKVKDPKPAPEPRRKQRESSPKNISQNMESHKTKSPKNKSLKNQSQNKGSIGKSGATVTYIDSSYRPEPYRPLCRRCKKNERCSADCESSLSTESGCISTRSFCKGQHSSAVFDGDREQSRVRRSRNCHQRNCNDNLELHSISCSRSDSQPLICHHFSAKPCKTVTSVSGGREPRQLCCDNNSYYRRVTCSSVKIDSSDCSSEYDSDEGNRFF